MPKLKKPCAYCGDPILNFQEAYHKGCVDIRFEKRVAVYKKQIRKLKKQEKHEDT